MFFTPPVRAEDSGCTLVVDFKTAEILHETGKCHERHGAQSTFKIPLALMGFDSGILKDAHNPTWNYKPEYNADMEIHRHAADPTRWEKDSVVWYSQELTRALGPEKFQRYIATLNYGNKDISGDPGKNNGLTHSWLSSSLKISPAEQVGFIRKLLRKEFVLSDHAYRMTKAIIPEFTAAGWTVHGKTGTGYGRTQDGSRDKDIVEGWFVGWAVKDGHTVTFAKFVSEKPQAGSYAGPRARDAFLSELPGIMAHDRHHQH